MSTYSELIQQAQELMAQAESARKAELAGVVSEIKAKMREYGLTVEDLEKSSAGRKAKGEKSAPQFRGPDGELWSGGPGRRPEWVKKIQSEGGNIEDYRIAA